MPLGSAGGLLQYSMRNKEYSLVQMVGAEILALMKKSPKCINYLHFGSNKNEQ